MPLEQLKEPHDSRPWNPLIANAFYRRGIIETWGRGTLKILELTQSAGLPDPVFKSEAGHFVVIFRLPEEKRMTPQDTMHDTMQVTMHDTMQVTPQVEQLLAVCKTPLSRQEIQDQLKLRNRDYFRKNYLKPALDAGLIERTIPEAPRSKFQKYRLTQAGKDYLQYKKSE